MTKTLKRARRAHVLQQDQRDCGPSCLLAIQRFFGGDSHREEIRRLCGTNANGTTFLGIKKGAEALGFDAEGYKGTIQYLKEHKNPVVLQWHLPNGLNHFVVCFGTWKDNFVVSDPAEGVTLVSPAELDEYWKSKFLLSLSPNKRFQTTQQKTRHKLQWLLSMIRENIPVLVLCTTLGIILSLLGLSMAIYSQQLIDVIIPSKDLKKAIVSAVLVGILLVFRLFIQYLRQLFLFNQSKEVGQKLNLKFFTKLLYLPKLFFDTRRTGDFISRLRDVTILQNTVINLSGNLLIEVLSIASVFGLLFYYNTIIGFFCLSVFPVFLFLIIRQNEKIVALQENVMATRAECDSNYINVIQGLPVVKSHNKQDFFSNKASALYRSFQNHVFNYQLLQNRLGLTVGVASVIVTTSILIYAIRSVLTGSLQIGEMTAILTLCASLIASSTAISMYWIPIKEATTAFTRMYDYVSIPSEGQRGNAPELSFQNLKLDNIGFRFDGKPDILKNISFQVNVGEAILITGKSGEGKSLLAQLILQHYSPTAGEILINGTLNLKEQDLNLWRTKVGIVPQDIHLFQGTLIYNICLSEDPQTIEATIASLQHNGFDPFFSKMPRGYLTPLGEDGVILSGGQRQMVGFARALCAAPALLILDEATAHMDEQSEDFVFNTIDRIQEHAAVIWISHRFHSSRAKHFCRTYQLSHGMLQVTPHVSTPA